MKKIVLFAILFYVLAVTKAQPSATAIADPYFNANGIGAGPQGSSNIFSIILQPDGKIVFGGDFHSYNNNSNINYLCRLNPDGSIDNSFANVIGRAVSDIALQPDGKILVSSYLGAFCGVFRFDTGGIFDPTFRADSVFATSCSKIALQPDGKILVGREYNDVFIRRLNSDGSLDTTFILDPRTYRNSSNAQYGVLALALQTDGKIIVGGYKSVPNQGNFYFVFRLKVDGSLDSTFLANNLSSTGAHFATALQPDGKILIGGSNSNNDFLKRFNPDGSLDSAFQVPHPLGSASLARNIIVQPDGKILVSGLSPEGVGRFNSNGTIDSTFEVGYLTSNGTFLPPIISMALQPDGKIIVGGNFTGLYTVNQTLNTPQCIGRLIAPFSPSLINPILQLEADTSAYYFGDTLHIKVKVNNGNNLFSIYSHLQFNDYYLRYVGYIDNNYLGTNVLTLPPTISGGSIDFGVNKTNGQSGTTGSGYFYEFQFVLKQLPRIPFNISNPNFFPAIFCLANSTIYDANGAQIYDYSEIPVTTKLVYYVPVWPGDLNNDRTVNVADLLPIGYFYNDTGAIRPGASLQWTAQPSILWGFDVTSQNSSGYRVFADGTGNGVVDLADQTAIGFNLTRSHARSEQDYHNPNRGISRSGAVPLIVDIPQTLLDSSQLPTTLHIPITLGDIYNSADSLYGVAFDLLFNADDIDTGGIQIDYSGSIFGTVNTDYIRIEDNQALQGRVSIGLTRYNTTELNTNGKLLTLSLPVKKTAISGWFKVEAIPLAANDKLGNNIAINYGLDSVLLITQYNPVEVITLSDELKVQVAPNPNTGIFTVQFFNSNPCFIQVMDISGKIILETKVMGKQQINLGEISNGVYLLNISENAKHKQVKFIVAR